MGMILLFNLKANGNVFVSILYCKPVFYDMTEMDKTDFNLNQNAFKSILNMYRLKSNNNNNM